MRHRWALAAVLLVALGSPAEARALELDVGLKTGAAVVTSPSLLGYGGGFGACASLTLLSPFSRATLGLAADVLLVFGFGPAVAFSVGPVLRYSVSVWRPELGLFFQYLGGSLVRAGDDEGRLPANPAAIQLGLAPLRFASRSSKAWVSFLATRYGWTFAEGRSSMVLTISAVELGRTF